METTYNPKDIEVIYKVVGVCFENRQDILAQFYKDYEFGKKYLVNLRPENDNQYDSNAIGVWIVVNGIPKHVGYISKDSNAELRRMLPDLRDCFVNSIGISPKGIVGFTIKCVF